MERINTILAHAWMVRTFLKHADEIQDDDEMLAVPRTIFDFVRAVETSYQRKDAKEYLLRASGKLSNPVAVAGATDRQSPMRSAIFFDNFDEAAPGALDPNYFDVRLRDGSTTNTSVNASGAIAFAMNCGCARRPSNAP